MEYTPSNQTIGYSQEIEYHKCEIMRRDKNITIDQVYLEQDRVDAKKDELIDEIELRMKQKINRKKLFTIKWRVI